MRTLFATEAAGVSKRSPSFQPLTLNVNATSIGFVALPFSAFADSPRIPRRARSQASRSMIMPMWMVRDC